MRNERRYLCRIVPVEADGRTFLQGRKLRRCLLMGAGVNDGEVTATLVMIGAVQRYLGGLSRNTFLLASASLFADISTEMLYPVLPVFLTQILKASGSVVGLVDGFAQATHSIVQSFSGALSDKLQTRKAIALAGYLFVAVARSLVGLSCQRESRSFEAIRMRSFTCGLIATILARVFSDCKGALGAVGTSTPYNRNSRCHLDRSETRQLRSRATRRDCRSDASSQR